MPSIMVVPIVPAPLRQVNGILHLLEKTFRLHVRLKSDHAIDPAPAYDASRNQYHSSFLLAALLNAFPHHEGKILAITGNDLFIPVLTYVFGEAQLDGVAAVVSSHRLDERFYGMTQNANLFQQRLLKESVHELGHTFGLVHCRRFNCVMYSTTSVEEIDIRSENFCPECHDLLEAGTTM